jgi:hypothetical protein
MRRVVYLTLGGEIKQPIETADSSAAPQTEDSNLSER